MTLQTVNRENDARTPQAPAFAPAGLADIIARLEKLEAVTFAFVWFSSLVSVELAEAVAAAAVREDLSVSAFARRALDGAIAADDGVKVGRPIMSKRGPPRPRGSEFRNVRVRIARGSGDRLDTIARRRGMTRAAFFEEALQAALARETPGSTTQAA
jgi:hypothetical protein